MWLLQFLPRFPLKKSYAERCAAVLLYTLAIVVAVIAVAVYRSSEETSFLAIAIAAQALVVMPMLARLKRSEAR